MEINKTTQRHRQQYDDCWGEGDIRELHGNGKNTINIR